MEARRYPGQVDHVSNFIGPDGRLQDWVEPAGQAYGEKLRRDEGPIVTVVYGSLAPAGEQAPADDVVRRLGPVLPGAVGAPPGLART